MTSCRVIVKEVCQKGHVSERRCGDPKGLPCRSCDRERKAIERENARNAEAQRRREKEREAAVTRLDKARREATLQKKELAHELELTRLEKQIKRVQIDANITKSTKESIHVRAASSMETRPSSTETSSTANQGNKGKCPLAKDHPKQGKTKLKPSAGRKPPPYPAPLSSSNSEHVADRGGNALPSGLQASTLFQIVQAARERDARGIVDALQAVPIDARKKTSHDLAVAIGDQAYDWFPPDRGGEVPCVPTDGARTIQALGLMASGQWVKARPILGAVVTEGAKHPSKLKSPAAAYALALCDYHIGGTSTAAEQLTALQAVDCSFWPGPPDGHPLPPGRAFPLGALVRAHLESATSSTALPPDNSVGNDGAKLRACVLAVGFILAPPRALKAGGVDSPVWIEKAEAIVENTGGALVAALWGSHGIGNETEKESEQKETAEDVFVSQWQKLQSKWGSASEALDELLEMSGLDVVKSYFLDVARSVIVDIERGYDPASNSFNVRLEGNPGTGMCFALRMNVIMLVSRSIEHRHRER